MVPQGTTVQSVSLKEEGAAEAAWSGLGLIATPNLFSPLVPVPQGPGKKGQAGGRCIQDPVGLVTDLL